MQKTKTIALALILFLGICTTPALAITASDEEIITKAVAAALQAVESTRAPSNMDTTSENSVSMEDVLNNLDPREQITIESLQRIEQILKNQKNSAASNLQASILDTTDTTGNYTSNSEAIASAMETIRGLSQTGKYSKDATSTSATAATQTTEEAKIEITPISPDLLRSSAEPLMQFSRSLTRKAASPLDVVSTVKTNILAVDKEATGERVAAEAYHRAADENSTSIFSTQNLIVLGISLAFLIIGVVLFFIRFEKKLLSTNGKFEHLSFFQKDHNKTIL